MRTLLCTTSLTSVLMLAALPAAAQTTIDTKVTTPVATATANDGAQDDIKITADGSVVPTSGSAVTLNSHNDVDNEGTIQITDADGAVGIEATAAGSGTITNGGNIILDESYTPTDNDDDGDLDGPFAEGSDRFGIRTDTGFTGSIVNTGSITVNGNDSGGIALGGPLTGSINSSGTITVTGDNGYGVHTGDVSGDVKISGAVTVQGKDSVGVAVDGDVGGAVVLQGSVGATGFRYTTPPSDTSTLDDDDLLIGGPAVRIAGNVAGGVLLDIPPTDTDSDNDDEDGDGIPDSDEGSAAIVSYGSAPALEIGAANKDITLGAVDGDDGGHGLVVRGSITASGVYDGINATALQVGGTGGNVDLSGGLSVSGTVQASSAANATAIHFGDGAIAPDITNSGTITASGGGDAADVATAILIDAGAQSGNLSNSGTIQAGVDTDATAIAINDESGTLTSLTNSGAITAQGGNSDSSQAIAIDLSHNGNGVTVQQVAPDADDASAPVIRGEVRFGSGADTFDIAAGSVNGAVDFGGGDNQLALSGNGKLNGSVSFGSGADTLTLSDSAQMQSDVDFGGGADTLMLGKGTVLQGKITGSSGLNATVSGTLDATNSGTVALNSLNVSGTGMIGVTIDGANDTNTLYHVTGNAGFSDGAKVLVHLTNIADSLGDHVIVQAGSITGGDALSSTGAVLPYLFKSSVSADADAGTVTLSILRKSATELGMNKAESAAYDAIFNVLDKDQNIAGTFLSITDGETFLHDYRQFLPEQAGGLFESVTLAARAGARFLTDRVPANEEAGHWNIWGQSIGWGTSKGLGDTATYSVGGWGASAGAEHKVGGLGYIGGMLSFALGLDHDNSSNDEVSIGQYEAAIHWRARFGGLGLAARGGIARLDFDGTRRFDTDSYSRVADSKWHGMLYSLIGSMSYDLQLTKRIGIRPTGGIQYFRMHEEAHSDSGGGDAYDLSVDARTSDELAASGTMTLRYDLGSLNPQETWLRLEVEGGRREIVGGAIADTTAAFTTGDSFTIPGGTRDSGWLGRIRLTGGQDQFSLGGELGAEQQQGRAAVSGRVTASFGW
ncbi:autotransporter outer membrane beta-barrel domain-containing protein [Stakelama sediminis]|uniref:Autotransporter domain-containing protein n=1 Tax=Stakelama sediminis TaxID=463200 RepID=A0A840YYB2_9SPHN|nr:autotransporter domain-containing protein [Stakelama sediminis]MBB5718537.1 hypothetical protein [Stakelama sediminis]